MTVTLIKSTAPAAEPLATLDTPKGTRVRMANGATGTLRWFNSYSQSEWPFGIELDEIGPNSITANWASLGTVTVLADQTPPTEMAHEKLNRRIAELRATKEAEQAQREEQATEKPAPAARPVATVSVPGSFADWLEGTGAVQGDDDSDPECLALRLAFDSGKSVRRGRSYSLMITGDVTVMDMIIEYADTFLNLGGEATQAELSGATRTLERATAARAGLKAAPPAAS
ncbi:hypothetical protein [Kitasatospora sp. NPDC088548]|uniref:hypothetical protein n=1 Tax=Kitasatospora sp. NPDC088548 TaxID=3364075 RepID=UPI0037F83974